MRKLLMLGLAILMVVGLSTMVFAGSSYHSGSGEDVEVSIISSHGNVTDFLTIDADWADYSQSFVDQGEFYYGRKTQLDRDVDFTGGFTEGFSRISDSGYDDDFAELTARVEGQSGGSLEQSQEFYRPTNAPGSIFATGSGDYDISQSIARFDSDDNFEGGASVNLAGSGNGFIDTGAVKVGGVPAVHASHLENMDVWASGTGSFSAQTSEIEPIWGNPRLSHSLEGVYDNTFESVDVTKSTGSQTSLYNFDIGLDMEAGFEFK